MIFSYLLNMQSHPSWVCGLKLISPVYPLLPIVVTPFVGVWIETLLQRIDTMRAESHPSWVCGLKRTILKSARALGESHPSWVCGLKQPYQ